MNLPGLRTMAYASLLIGGFLVITFLAFAYFAAWRHEFLPIFPQNPPRANPGFNASAFPVAFEERRERIEPLSAILAPQALGIFAIGLFLVYNGYALLRFLQHKENKETRKFVTASLLTPEEKAVYESLIKSGGQATQKQLGLQAGFSAVKTFRIVKRLEGRKIVKTFPFGMTKKVILNEA